MQVEVKIAGLDGVLDTLKSLPPEVVSKNGGPVKASLRKGAMVLVKQARSNFRSAVAQAGVSGITNTTGFTEKQIVAKRRTLTYINGEKMVVTVNYVKHPAGSMIKAKSRKTTGKRRGRKGPANREIRANDIAFIMEYGAKNQPAIPWLRPAFEAKADEAIRTVETDLARRIKNIVGKLAAKNQGK